MRLVVLNGLLILFVALTVVGIQTLDRADAAVEASVRRYAAAVSNSDFDGALAEIAPGQRGTWEGWVRHQMGNVYEVRGIAVRSPSLLQRVFAGAPGKPFEVTVILDINRGYPGEFYQPTPHVPVQEADGRWYLGAPLLATS